MATCNEELVCTLAYGHEGKHWPAEADPRRDQIISDLADMMAMFQVPASIGRIGLEPVAIPWRRLHRELHKFGWAKKEDYERELREALGLEPVS